MTPQKAICMVFLFASFIGCKNVALHHNLQEIEVDEILVTLQQNGIEAKKEKEVSGQEVSWNVTVGDADLARARQILITNKLPRRRELGLSGVYKDKGLIPTPDEQKARFLLALKGEIINSIQKIPGVVDSDVVLNVPEAQEFEALDPVKKRPTASVIVRTRNEDVVAQTVTEGKIQRFVANAVPNLDPNDVVVIVTRAEIGVPFANSESTVGGTSPLMMPTSQTRSGISPNEDGEEDGGEIVEMAGLHLDRDSVVRFKIYAVGLLSLLVGVSLFLLFNIIRLNRVKLKVQRAGRPSRMLEGPSPSGLLADGQGQPMEGTFDTSARQRP